jgi:hypothetical protein
MKTPKAWVRVGVKRHLAGHGPVGAGDATVRVDGGGVGRSRGPEVERHPAHRDDSEEGDDAGDGLPVHWHLVGDGSTQTADTTASEAGRLSAVTPADMSPFGAVTEDACHHAVSVAPSSQSAPRWAIVPIAETVGPEVAALMTKAAVVLSVRPMVARSGALAPSFRTVTAPTLDEGHKAVAAMEKTGPTEDGRVKEAASAPLAAAAEVVGM